MSSTFYHPTKPEHFIGSTRDFALMARQIAAESKPTGKPIKLLANGKPGIGKSALMNFIIAELGAHPQWSTTKINGAKLNVERCDEIEEIFRTTSLFGWRVLWIEECDAIVQNPKVQLRILTMLDDLPRESAVLCTSNCRLDQFEKRFQSRFRPMELEPPTKEELIQFLQQWVPLATAVMIADGAKGDVRMALNDVENALTAAALPKAA